MGSYDDITLLQERPGMSCAGGHAVKEFQTKDFDGEFGHYFLIDDLLYLKSTNDKGDIITTEKDVNGDIFVVRKTPLVKTYVSCEALVYTTCYECNPVLYLRDHDSVFHDLVQERRPFIEFALTFKEGSLTSWRTANVETRASIAKELSMSGIDVLDDDDRIAKRHMARRNK